MIERIILATLVMALLVAGMAGCGSRDQGITQAGDMIPATTATTEPSATVEASTTGEAGSEAAGDATSPDTSAIEAELSAIETELGSMSMPSDSDFSALEGDIE
ncbi:MAG: hypothetical protein ACYC77_04360 [Coriobacteriia bacterium]